MLNGERLWDLLNSIRKGIFTLSAENYSGLTLVFILVTPYTPVISFLVMLICLKHVMSSYVA